MHPRGGMEYQFFLLNCFSVFMRLGMGKRTISIIFFWKYNFVYYRVE